MNARVPERRTAPQSRPRAIDAANELRAAGEALVRAAHVIAALGQRAQEQGATGRSKGDLRGAAPPQERLTGKQLGAVRAIARRAGLSREHLAKLIEEATGKQEPSALTRAEASTVLERLASLVDPAR
jgi:hypothetical protein